jgi:hypothetical protein
MDLKQTERIYTFYADDTNNTVISCPFCGFTRKVDVSGFQEKSKAFLATCKCGQKFNCLVEFRKCYRKQVHLAGEFIILKNNKKGIMLVKDISYGGISFENMSPHTLEKDELLELKFNLDDPLQSKIIHRVKVMTIDRQSVGTEFIDKKNIGSDLGFYLFA